ncbi:MAG: SDR family NAD(P)-dependent oxidoreductase [Desulfovibrionaceae bacterium]|nr:SDR family NAD(P)-dependent oxidoreductase [Desulfovibrionaceae bacterium]
MGKVCVTGGSGFIGSALVRELSARGRKVKVFDNNSRGAMKNLESVRGDIQFIEGDIRNLDDVRNAVEGCSEVYHLAFINGTEYFYNKPDLVLDVGIRGHLAVMDACAELGAETLIYASSSEVYQTPPVIPTPEDVPASIPDVLNPRYSYGGAKLAGELLTLHYRMQSPLKRIIFRPHNIYGPAMGFEHVIPQIVKKIHTANKKNPGRPVSIEIQGDGSQTRAFCNVLDAVRGIILLGEQGNDREIYNVGVNEETSIRDLILAICEHLGIEATLVPGELPKGGTLRRCPDISKLQGLGYSPEFNLHEGLRETVQWYWSHYEDAA